MGAAGGAGSCTQRQIRGDTKQPRTRQVTLPHPLLPRVGLKAYEEMDEDTLFRLELAKFIETLDEAECART